MASLRKSPNSPNWIICYRSPEGTQHQVSSHLPAKPSFRNQAMHLGLELELAAKKKSAPQIDHINLQMQLQKLSAKALGIVGQSATPPAHLTLLGEMFERWLAGKKNTRSKPTFLRYLQVVREFTASVGVSFLKLPVSHIQPQHIEKFLLDLANRGQTPGNQRTKIKILRSFFARAISLHMITHNPASPIELPTGSKNTREPFTVDELKKLMAVSNANWRTLILLGAYAGLRLGDAANLTWQNIDLEARTITYLPRKKDHLANIKKTVVPMHPEIYETILNLPVGSKSPQAKLFEGISNKGCSGRGGLSMAFTKLMAKAGIDPLPIKVKGQRTFQAKTFHSLRHTFVTLMAENNVSQELRRELAGHDSDVHRIYTHYSTDTYRKAIESIPSLTPHPAKKT